jgi:SAM-dependent methyltransferase
VLIGAFDAETPDIETASAGYAERFSGSLGQFFLDTQARAVVDLLAPWPKARVLDVGGGHAQTAGVILGSGREVTVAGSGEASRQRLDRLLPRGSFQFQTCNLLALPFEDRSFDVALAFRLLPHVRRWETLIAELCRVSAHAVIIDYPDWRSFNLLSVPLFRLKKSIEGNTRPFRCFHGRELRREFASHGFGSPAVRRQFFFPMALHRALGRAGFSRLLESCGSATGLTAVFGSPVVLRVLAQAPAAPPPAPAAPGEPRD